MNGLPPGVRAEHVLAFVAALVACAGGAHLAAGAARRLGFVATPRADRWSRGAVPLGGGVAVVAVLSGGLWFGSPDLLVAVAAVFLLGLVDDLRGVSPPAKLVVQTLAACWMVAAPLTDGGPSLLFRAPNALALPLTIVWYVGVCNAVNLLDNMDGSAAGVVAVATAFVYVLAVGGLSPDPRLATAAAVLAGACLGFLSANFPPARVFLGDAGSLPLGFALAGLAISLPRGGGGLRELAIPAFLLGTPIFDTALVWFGRRAARRPFLAGGTDHTTHRLVALGLSERRTLVVLYGATAALGGVALAIARGGLGTAVITALAGGAALVLGGLLLGEARVYPAAQDSLSARSAGRWRPLLYSVELLVDVGLLSAAWLGAYALRFDGEDLAFYLRASALPALPVVIGAKVLSLFAFRLYRGVWKNIAGRDLFAIGKAVSLASLIIVVAATGLQRFEHYSRGVVVIDWLLSLGAVAFSRSALRLGRDALSGLADRPRRAVLLGPRGLLPLLERDLDGLELVGTIGGSGFEGADSSESPDLADGAGLVEQARAAEAEVVLVGLPLAPNDPRLGALGRAFELRWVRASTH
ncbi:MAG: hypothetical protein D6731_19700 [Planctomycetota bacterium]|nr:MAG: hypothetical protein D6731_19700 [Planctomycetota bacterium]